MIIGTINAIGKYLHSSHQTVFGARVDRREAPVYAVKDVVVVKKALRLGVIDTKI